MSIPDPAFYTLNSAYFGGGYSGTVNNCPLNNDLPADSAGKAYPDCLDTCIGCLSTAPDETNHEPRSSLDYRCTTPQATRGFGNVSSFQNKVRAQVARQDPVLSQTLLMAAQQVIDALGNGGSTELAGKMHSLKHQPSRKMKLKFSGTTGRVQIVEASTNLVDWETIGVAADQGDASFEFEDANASKFPGRFYRIKQLPR
jgi:hypothetical protein